MFSEKNVSITESVGASTRNVMVVNKTGHESLTLLRYLQSDSFHEHFCLFFTTLLSLNCETEIFWKKFLH